MSTRPGPPSGVPLLDDPGPHPCVARWSRATGLPAGPDVEGLAVRLEGPAAGDVLFASTGTGRITRHLLVVRGRRSHGPMTTLLPLRTARGSLLLRLDPLTGTAERTSGQHDQTGTGSGTHRTHPAQGDPSHVSPAVAIELPTAYRPLVSAPGRPWHERGELRVTWADMDSTRRHDPVGHPPAGTWTDPFWARLRDPSYAAAQKVAAKPLTP